MQRFTSFDQWLISISFISQPTFMIECLVGEISPTKHSNMKVGRCRAVDFFYLTQPGCVAQSVARLSSIPVPTAYFRFSLRCRVVRWCWVNFQCRGVLLILIIVGQGPTALPVGAGRVVWTFFSQLSFLSSFSLSMEDGPI